MKADSGRAQSGMPAVDAADPATAYERMAADSGCALVDVRTRAEWSFVGVPDLSGMGRPLWLVEWVRFPEMALNSGFIEELVERAGGMLPEQLFFICRSGVRSQAAAEHVAAASAASGRPVRCTNIVEGFEGDRDADGHRGTANGWKARGLPWVQS